MFYKTYRKGLCIPFVLFEILFVIRPRLFIVYYAFTDSKGYFTFQAFTDFFSNRTKLNVLFVSLLIGLVTTIICRLIGFPIAWILAGKDFKSSSVFVRLFVIPRWINFVLRTGALRDLLNVVYGWFGKSTGELPYLSAIIGLVTDYLPFTIIPLHSTLLKLDHSQIEAAKDLGCNPFHTFTRSIIPQARPGIISACRMVFRPTISSYVITDVRSERQLMLFGNSIETSFSNSDWEGGSFMALIRLVIIFITRLITKKFNDKSEKEGSGSW